MTLAEITRRIESYNRTYKLRQQEQATFDYILADLMGRSFARTQHSANKMPAIHEAYPTLFNAQEIEEQRQVKQMELSALRFKQYAMAHNNKFKQEVANKE